MTVAREALRQQVMLRTLLRDTGPEALAALTRDGPFFQRGLQAYQAHASAQAQRALAAAYPTLQQLLGEVSFNALARAFWHRSPPVVGDLACWGAELPDFVAAAPDLAEEPYLGDVAQLEWAVHRASTAADHTPAPHALQHLGEADPALFCLVPRAGTALVPSQHPIVSIWQAHHLPAAAGGWADESSGDSADVPTNERFATVREAFAQHRAEPALVWRQGWQVKVAALGAAEARFTLRVLQGEALGAALQAASAAAPEGTGPGFDFEHWLLLQLQRGWLAGVGPVRPTGDVLPAAGMQPVR